MERKKYEVGKTYIFNYIGSPLLKLGDQVEMTGDQKGLIEVVGGIGNAYQYAGKVILIEGEATSKRSEWDYDLTDREKGLITSCLAYAKSTPHGLPRHNLILLVAKLVDKLDAMV